MDSRVIRDKHQQFTFAKSNYYAEPIALVRGNGVRVWDADGGEYIDLFGGIATVSLGHCHPEVTEAVREQVGTLVHASTLYPGQPLVEFAERLATIMPTGPSGKPLRRSFFTNSGSEANEMALMFAKVHTGRAEIIALRHGYSGRTLLAMTVTGQGAYRSQPSQAAGVVHAHAPYCYRCPFKLTYPSCELQCAKDIEELIRTVTCGQPAAFIAESILGVAGFVVPPPEYFEVAVGIVRSHGGLFVCDEVQSGFGRTGKHWLGIEHWGVKPDVVTFAKGIANGFPMGATVTSDDISASWRSATISTFGGNPVSARAAFATLGVMQREGVPDRAERVGKRLSEALVRLKDKHTLIGEVRGKGLMQAIELVRDRTTKEPGTKETIAVMEACRKRGLLIGKGGLYGNVLRICPPMLIAEADLDDALTRLDAAFDEVGKVSPGKA